MEQTTTTTTSGSDTAAGAKSEPNTLELNARIQGLDRKVTELASERAKMESLLADYAKKAKDAEMALAEKDTAIQATQSKVSEYEKKIAEESTRAANLEKLVGRQKLFMGDEFFELRRFEEKGLLRTDLEGDALIKYLKDYKEEIGTVAKKSVGEALEGGLPTAGSSKQDGVDTLDSLYKQFDEAMRNGTPAQQQDLENRIYALEQAKKK